MGYDGRTMTTYNGGRQSHWREPAPAAPALHLRIVNDRHIVTFLYSVDGAAWTRHELRFETSGYHANTAGQLLSLRPAIFAAAGTAVAFRDFRYRALP
jgi:xylan 1,4-beta-xylosidase